MPSPAAQRSPYAYDGTVNGLIFDDLTKQIQNVYTGTNTPDVQGGGEGGLSGLGAGNSYGVGNIAQLGGNVARWSNNGNDVYRQLLTDGTENDYTRGPNGELVSANKTTNDDPTWQKWLDIIAPAAIGGVALSGIGAGLSAGLGGVAGTAAAGAGAANDVGGLAALDSAAVASEGAAPGLFSGAGAADLPIDISSGSLGYSPFDPSGYLQNISADSGVGSTTGNVVGATAEGAPVYGADAISVTGAAPAAASTGIDWAALAPTLGLGTASAATLAALASGGGGSASSPTMNASQIGRATGDDYYSDPATTSPNSLPDWATKLLSDPTNLLKLGTSGLGLLGQLLSKRPTGTGAATNPTATTGAGSGAYGAPNASFQAGLSALANRGPRTFNPYTGDPIKLAEQGGGHLYFSRPDASSPVANNGSAAPTAQQMALLAQLQSPNRYARGGMVQSQGLSQLPSAPQHVGPGLVQGSDGGQSDMVPAMLSPGEMVLDAGTVADLGDGNTAAGAAKLDQMRQALRKHKRAAPATSIPPAAKSIQSYLG